jgi:hypothetical protein
MPAGDGQWMFMQADARRMGQQIELRVSYRYVKAHPWVVQAMTGFLSAYFMENPEFRVHRHFVELESGMHVWVCDIPSNMKVFALLKRLQVDIPPCHYKRTQTDLTARPQYVIDSPEAESPAT